MVVEFPARTPGGSSARANPAPWPRHRPYRRGRESALEPSPAGCRMARRTIAGASRIAAQSAPPGHSSPRRCKRRRGPQFGRKTNSMYMYVSLGEMRDQVRYHLEPRVVKFINVIMILLFESPIIIVLGEQEASFELAGEFKIAPTGRGFLFAVLAV